MASTDRDVLLILYRSTGGTEWNRNTNWCTAVDLADWDGVEVNEQDRVVKLPLVLRGLRGPIPKELGTLSKLERLWLNSNQLTGPIPKELGALSELKALVLEENALTGAIPAHLGDLNQLTVLDLSNNQLSGHIPPQLGDLGALMILYLANNKLNGAIPAQLGDLSQLEILDLSNNQLSGTIPPELGNLVALWKLDLSWNKMSGPIPKELGALSKLLHLCLQGNGLTGLGATEDALRLLEGWKGFGSELILENNPWIVPPEAVVEAGHLAMETYFVDVREAEKAGLNVATVQLLKVVFVGSASAGKTSLMNSIVAGCGRPTRGTPEEVSTVGVEMLHHQVQDTKIEFYDCAGQVNYAGMHQTFLTRRALYLLVVDITKYQNPIHLDKVIHFDIMRWLYYLYLRAPGSTVILVANKCDGSIDDFADTAQRIYKRVRELLDAWHHKRGLRGQTKGRVDDMTILPGMSRVSCDDKGSPETSGLPALEALIASQVTSSIVVPPAWELALEVMGALRAGCDPIPAARRKLRLSNMPLTGQVGDAQAFAFISKVELSRRWKEVVENLSGGVPAAAISNWESALQGALWISDFAGHTLRIDDGEGIFLDAPWLSEVLNPILSHKIGSQVFEYEWLPMRRRLVEDNVLRRDFARHLWSGSIGDVAVQSEKIVGALFLTLIKLGVALPLGLGGQKDGSDASEMLLVMKLDEECSDDKQRRFNELVANKQPRDREVVLKWKFDKAGPPQGLVERVITSCHVLGKVKYEASWRYGTVFTSHIKRGGVESNLRLYTVALSMSYADPERELTARVVGPLEDERVWAAIRYVASAVVTISLEWPGVLWDGWPECPERHREKVYLARSARVGHRLLPAAAPDAEREEWCHCLVESVGVLALVLKNLGNVVDTGKDPFDDLTLGGTGHGVKCNCESEVFRLWRPQAGRTARWLFGLAMLLFTTAVLAGIVENLVALWTSALAVSCVLLALAVAASVVECRSILADADHARQDETYADIGVAVVA